MKILNRTLSKGMLGEDVESSKDFLMIENSIGV